MLSKSVVFPPRYGPTSATQRFRATVPPFIRALPWARAFWLFGPVMFSSRGGGGNGNRESNAAQKIGGRLRDQRNRPRGGTRRRPRHRSGTSGYLDGLAGDPPIPPEGGVPVLRAAASCSALMSSCVLDRQSGVSGKS